MFESLGPMPPDSILGLMQAFREDPRPGKIDLGVGVYKDANGETPVLSVVKKAEALRLENESSKSYIGPAGAEGYNAAVQGLVFGSKISAGLDSRLSVVQTPGGCGALRVAAEFIGRCRENATVHVPDPTWANHIPLLGDAGLSIQEYPYLDRTTGTLRFDAMASYLGGLGPGDLVLLHGCCHNPCGVDLDQGQWQAKWPESGVSVCPTFKFRTAACVLRELRTCAGMESTSFNTKLQKSFFFIHGAFLFELSPLFLELNLLL